ncbi:MAG: hypothetical protein L0226_04605 [Acidobacteria bacterium]|nr:hypothetical protein [Acidobacteriota bacterium]
MFRSPLVRIILVVILAITVLGVLRYKPWQRSGGQTAADADRPREQLSVGFLPVT